MKNKITILVVVLIFLIITSACAQFDSLLGNADEIVNVEAEEPVPSPTQLLIDTPTFEPSATLISSPTLASTDTPPPSPTSTEELSPTIEPSPTIAQPSCTDIAELDRHLSINDGSVLQPNTLYAKVWRIKNVGTCTWNTNYMLAFSNGDDTLKQPDVPLSNEVLPGETIELKVNFTTQEKGNTYIGNWMLRSDSGIIFGVGPNADQPIALNFVLPNQSDVAKSC